MRLSALLREPLERLIAAGTSFAMWRAGEEEEPRLVMQTDGGSEALPDVFALNGRSGFVLAPFRVTEVCLGHIPASGILSVFIGPEGGFEETEVAQAKDAGFEPITLGRRILRTETAGLTVMSWLMYRLEGAGI